MIKFQFTDDFGDLIQVQPLEKDANTWHSVVDNYGAFLSVLELNWPNKRYFTRIVEQLYPLPKKPKKISP